MWFNLYTCDACEHTHTHTHTHTVLHVDAQVATKALYGLNIQRGTLEVIRHLKAF